MLRCSNRSDARPKAVKPTDVLPRVQIGNRLAAQCLYDRYVSGMTLGTLARRLGLYRASRGAVERFERLSI